MQRAFEVSALAKKELEEARNFYRDVSSKRGMDFLYAVQESFRQIETFPMSGAPFDKGLRKMILRKFPYVILYHVTDTRVLIVSIMHTRRKPPSFDDSFTV